MRLPFIDSSTGVAQKHSDSMRSACERIDPSTLPNRKAGQFIAYPQREWRKTKYAYLENASNGDKKNDDCSVNREGSSSNADARSSPSKSNMIEVRICRQLCLNML